MPEVDMKPKVESMTTNEDAEGTNTNLSKRINALKNVQMKMMDIEAKFFDEMHQLECKYATLYEPFYEQRRKIVVGEHEPTEEEAKWELGSMTDAVENAIENGGENMDEASKKLLGTLKNKLDAKSGKSQDADTKGVPNFWLETMQQCRMTEDLIQEHDEPILAFLQDIKVKLFESKPYGFTLEFYFAENPYFTNKMLTKSYEYITEVDSKDPFSFQGLDLKKTTGSKIEWNADKNVTVKIVKKKLKSKNNKKAPPKVVSKEEKQDSFFLFFDTPKNQIGEGGQLCKIKPDGGDETGDDEENEDDMYLIADYEIGQFIKEKVVGKAALFYTGELDGMEDEYGEYDDDEDDDEDEDDEEGDEDDDDDEEDDEDDEDEENAKKIVKTNGKGKKGRKGGEPSPSECKQN